jgi:hypothetical protein
MSKERKLAMRKSEYLKVQRKEVGHEQKTKYLNVQRKEVGYEQKLNI